MTRHNHSPVCRTVSRSTAVSEATFHSFDGSDTSRPSSPNYTYCPPQQTSEPGPSPSEKAPMSVYVDRRDSGYESVASARPDNRRRASTMSTTTSRTSKTKSSRSSRPSTRRATKSGPVAYIPRTTTASMYSSPPPVHSITAATAYFHFPSPDSPSTADDDYSLGGYGSNPSPYPSGRSHSAELITQPPPEAPIYPSPPQTTHYWTSDRTRRLEYAAIDAASRGVKGWVMRHMVPECFVPRESRRITFDDDTGSVRRYRLDLDEEDETEKGTGSGRSRKKSWLFGGGGGAEDRAALQNA